MALLAGVWGTALAGMPAQAAELPAPLAQAWRESKLPDASLSLVVRQIDGPTLMTVNPTVARAPGSTMKLVTTWAALSTLGPSYRWQTDFLVAPGTHLDATGALTGPLYLRAAGDPYLRLQDLWLLLRELRLRGVKTIPQLVIDRSVFGDVSIDPGAFDNSPDQPYNASPDAFMVNFGAERLLFLPDAAAHRWQPVLDPALPGVRLEGAVQWTGGECRETPDITSVPSVSDEGIVLRLSGAVPGACGEFNVYRLALDQPVYAMRLLQQLWTQMGGVLTGTVRSGVTPGEAVVLASHESPELAEVIRPMNKFSNNVMARTLLLTLGAERGGPGATVASSEAALQSVLNSQGLNLPGLVVGNGSGLSRRARISADDMAQVLDHAWHSPVMPEYLASLSISGEDGTVKRRMTQPGVAGMAHLKTGTLDDASAVAGFVQGASGKRYIVVSVVNDARAGAVRNFNNVLVAWLAHH